MISTIIIEPIEGDPLGLLRAGVCGAGPPVLTFWGCGGAHYDGRGVDTRDPVPLGWSDLEPPHKVEHGWCHHAKVHLRHGLVLAFRGKPVPEGCDRVDWALHRGAGRPGRARTYSHTAFPDGLPQVLEWPFEQGWIAVHLQGAGTLRLLDDSMQEVTP